MGFENEISNGGSEWVGGDGGDGGGLGGKRLANNFGEEMSKGGEGDGDLEGDGDA